VTAPDIKTPEQAKNVGLKIGEILRSCKVRRGIGTIRQDVSVSIKGGERVEMKGVQDLKLIIPTINNEVERQVGLVKEEKSIAEVRRGNSDAITIFLRPLPGSARMYPETDLPMLKISRDLINKVKKNLPRLRKDIEKELGIKGLNKEMIKLIFKMNKLEDFRELLEIVNNPQLVVKVLLVFPKEIERKIKVKKKFDKDIFVFILEEYKKGKINERQIKESLERIARGVDISDAVKFEKEDLENIEEKIMKIVQSKSGLSEKAYMGLVMKEFAGRIDGRMAMEIIKKYIK